MKRPPSDFDLLKAIYKHHRDEFARSRTAPPAGVLLPIDIPAVARTLGTDDDIVFGRLYYHLDRAYGEPPTDDKKPRKVFFTPRAGDEANCINFPLLEAVLAGLWQERNRQLWAVGLSVFSTAIAVAALIVSIVTA